MRKMVIMQSHEWLEESSALGSMHVAASVLDEQRVDGIDWATDSVPMPVVGFDAASAQPVRTGEFLVDVEVDDDLGADDAEGLLRDVWGDDIREVWSNPTIELVAGGVHHGNQLVGTSVDVVQALNLQDLVDANDRGQGVRVAIVDEGIHGRTVNVSGGFALPSITDGVGTGSVGSHGTMCALDVLLAAPNAQIRDYPLLRSTQGRLIGFMSDAIRIYSQLLIEINEQPGPYVINNSWGVLDRSTDAPVGHPQNYWANPQHPFNAVVGALAFSGADILFAAGNCGLPDPDGRCGTNDVGPGNSIHGANSHPEVTSVAGVTVHDDRLAYSSQGPGALDSEKPDVSGFTHFEFVGMVGNARAQPTRHTGTSAACPVVAGVVAALRSKPSADDPFAVSPAMMRDVLESTSRNVTGTAGWDADFGHGVVDAGAAWNAL